MTPKEKALELAMTFDKLGETDNAIKCALIAVNEIIKSLDYLFGTTKEVTYWREVKQEIEKL